MKSPQPRMGYHYGRRVSTEPAAHGTWVEPEEFAYPNGGFTRRAYVRLTPNPHNPIDLPYGQSRVVKCSIPDTYSTIPARLRYRGRTIKGYISATDNHDDIKNQWEPLYRFTPEADPAMCPQCGPNDGCRFSRE